MGQSDCRLVVLPGRVLRCLCKRRVLVLQVGPGTSGGKLCQRYYLPEEQAGCPVVFLLLEILAGYQISFGGCAKNHLAGHSGALLYLTLLSGCCSKGHPAGHSFALVLLTLLSGCCSKNHLAGQSVSLALA